MLQHIKSTEDWEEKSIGAKGFTLIELLVVIVILGILAAVVIFAVSGITDKGQTSACKAEASTVHTAIEAYDAEWTAYPASDAVMVPGFLETDPNSASPQLVAVSGFSATAAPTLNWAGPCLTDSAVSSTTP